MQTPAPITTPDENRCTRKSMDLWEGRACSKNPARWNKRVERKLRLWRFSLAAAAFLKRALDIVVSIGALLLLTPVLAATAVAIKLEDRGPVLFQQFRVGRNGKPFKMIKFRSMYTDADERKKQLQELNHHGSGAVTFKSATDPRITRVGAFIRKTSIDELPQFFNVLRGDMALVGPRPPVPTEVDLYRSMELRRLRVKPGITCIWQISGRADISFPGQVRLDLQYIHSESIWGDLRILFLTIPAVLLGKGAY
jgi:exopolysaccharide biosynthesis polyprenyl glycosylphosphotransferase